MNTNENKKILIEAILQKCKSFSDLDIKNVIREKDLGEKFSFKPAEETINKIRDLVYKIASGDLYILPNAKLIIINKIIIEIDKILFAMINYEPLNNPNDRAGLLNELDAKYQSLFLEIVPFLEYIQKPNESKIKEQVEEIQKTLESAKFMDKEIFEMKKSVSLSQEEIKQIVNSARDAAAEEGITVHSSLFATEADHHNILSRWWLGFTFVTIIISMRVAFVLLDLQPPDKVPSYYTIIHYALTKLVIFSLLYYSVVFCIKNYNAHRHNYVVNKHRKNALATFDTFVSSTKDDSTKNAVLLQATQSIFSQQISGYLKNESEPDNPNRFIEIIKSGANITSQKLN